MKEGMSVGLVVVDIVESVCRLATLTAGIISWLVGWMALVICMSLMAKGTGLSQFHPTALWVMKWIPPTGVILMALDLMLRYGGLGKALRKLFKNKENGGMIKDEE